MDERLPGSRSVGLGEDSLRDRGYRFHLGILEEPGFPFAFLVGDRRMEAMKEGSHRGSREFLDRLTSIDGPHAFAHGPVVYARDEIRIDTRIEAATSQNGQRGWIRMETPRRTATRARTRSLMVE